MRFSRPQRGLVGSILSQDEEELEGATVRLKPSTWAELDEISSLETEERKARRKKGRAKVYSRNDTIIGLLEFAIKHYWEARGGRPNKRGNR